MGSCLPLITRTEASTIDTTTTTTVIMGMLSSSDKFFIGGGDTMALHYCFHCFKFCMFSACQLGYHGI